jgi:hypothetical protein
VTRDRALELGHETRLVVRAVNAAVVAREKAAAEAVQRQERAA